MRSVRWSQIVRHLIHLKQVRFLVVRSQFMNGFASALFRVASSIAGRRTAWGYGVAVAYSLCFALI